MEKDEHPIPAIRLEERASAVNHYPHPYKGTELVNPYYSPRGNAVAAGMPATRMPRSHSSDHVSNSNDPMSHVSPIQNSTTSSYTNTSTLSSLGYVSEDPSYRGPSSMVRSSPNLAHYYSPRSKGNLGTMTSSEGTEFSSNGSSYSSVRPRMQKSRSQESAETTSSVRPTSLVLPNSAVTSLQAQQFFSCPNCRKTFSCNSNDTFEPWFDHIKTCGV